MSDPLLEIDGLSVRFETDEGRLRAVDDVSFAIRRGEIRGLVGESGCGKSATALALLGLAGPNARVAVRRASFDREPLRLDEPRALAALRGRRLGMIFQDPLSGLNPYLRVGLQMTEGPERHLGVSQGDARARAADLLQRCGMPDPERVLRAHPHELSGGMRQRVMIAAALLCEPDFLIADEPTTALDVTIQAQILALLASLVRERGTTLLFITHDLGVVAGLCDRVTVLYAGRVVEEADTAPLFEHPEHPYTRALLACAPRIGAAAGETFAMIPGAAPRPADTPASACTFAPRCDRVREACRDGEPALERVGPGHLRRCVLPPGSDS